MQSVCKYISQRESIYLSIWVMTRCIAASRTNFPRGLDGHQEQATSREEEAGMCGIRV